MKKVVLFLSILFCTKFANAASIRSSNNNCARIIVDSFDNNTDRAMRRAVQSRRAILAVDCCTHACFTVAFGAFLFFINRPWEDI